MLAFLENENRLDLNPGVRGVYDRNAGERNGIGAGASAEERGHADHSPARREEIISRLQPTVLITVVSLRGAQTDFFVAFFIEPPIDCG